MTDEDYLNFVYYYQRHNKVWDILWSKKISNHFTVTDVYLLELLNKHTEITPSFIAEELYLTSGGVTGLLERNIKNKLITKRKDNKDRRISLISMTEEGKNALIKLRKDCTQLTKSFLSVLTTEEILQLERLNKKLYQSY